MKYRVMTDFLWYHAGDIIIDEDFNPSWQDHVGKELHKIPESSEPESPKQVEKKVESNVLDVNEDGKVDEKDVIEIAKEIKSRKKKKRKTAKRGKR